MRRARIVLGALALAAALGGPLSAPAAWAQDSSVKATSPHFAPAEATAFSQQVEGELIAKGARVALVFRAGRGRDQLPKGISYTHGGFWVRETGPGGAPAATYTIYNLFAGDGDNWPKLESRLVPDRPVVFTQASTVDDMGVIIPTPEMQRKILAVIDSPAYAKMHIVDYSLISNPWAGKYQNCNAFMLNVIGAAMWDTDDRGRVLARLKTDFKPTEIETNALTRLVARIGDKRLRSDDHDGEIKTVSSESISRFMSENGLVQEAYTSNFKR